MFRQLFIILLISRSISERILGSNSLELTIDNTVQSLPKESQKINYNKSSSAAYFGVSSVKNDSITTNSGQIGGVGALENLKDYINKIITFTTNSDNISHQGKLIAYGSDFIKIQNTKGQVSIYDSINNLKLTSMRALGAVIKSVSDKRIYKAIELPNKLTCLIVSDNEAEKSSSALSVEAGSLQDPNDANGLAHYLQHMLFMGTTKYPNQNSYSQFLAKNSGYSNAYTSQTQTNYFFQVSSTAFHDTLDRFAQFFISPLMAESSSQRQLMAVHSQHTKNLLSDNWRQYQLWKSSTKPNHPLNKFSTGDKNSLGSPTIRNQLLEFYKKNYSANLMKLVVYGKEDVENMTKFVERTFGGIPNQDLKPYELKEMPFDEKDLGNMYKVVPIKNTNTVEFMWYLPSYEKEYRNPPGQYISHLLGHEGPGSLLSTLMKQGLALGLSAHAQQQYKLYSNLQVKISLTDKGLQNIPLIAGYLLYYIEMIKSSKPQKWIFDEIKTIKKLQFDFMDKKQGANVCAAISKGMHDGPVEEVLVRHYLMEQWKPELIEDYLSHIGLNNLRIVATSQKFAKECNQTELIYGTKYAVQKLPKLEPIKCNVHLPPANTFFPKDLTVLPLSLNEQPVKLSTSQHLDLFFKPDHRFQLAKGQIRLRLYFPTNNSPQQSVIRSIFISLLTNHLRQLTYMGQTAHISPSVSLSTICLEIQLKGFSDSLPSFLPQYLSKILSFLPDDPVQFSDIRTKKTREYLNFFMSNPYQQVYEYHVLALRDGGDVEPSSKLAEVSKVTFEQVVQFAKEWKKSVFTEMYVAGNFKEQTAREFAKVVEGMVRTQGVVDRGQVKSIRAVGLREGELWAIEKDLTNKDQQNSAIILHFQYEQLGITTKVLQDFSVNFIKEPAFDYLRTKQQLGYIVMCLPDDNRGVLGLSILIQSNVKPSHELRGYIDNLMKILRDKIDTLSNEEFEKIKKAAYTVKLQKDKNLGIESDRFWTEIVKHSYEFTRRKKELEEIPKVTLEDFKQFFTKVFLDSPKEFEFHLTSHSHKQSNGIFRNNRLKSSKLRIAPSIEWFKRRMPLHPDYYALL